MNKIKEKNIRYSTIQLTSNKRKFDLEERLVDFSYRTAQGNNEKK